MFESIKESPTLQAVLFWGAIIAVVIIAVSLIIWMITKLTKSDDSSNPKISKELQLLKDQEKRLQGQLANITAEKAQLAFKGDLGKVKDLTEKQELVIDQIKENHQKQKKQAASDASDRAQKLMAEGASMKLADMTGGLRSQLLEGNQVSPKDDLLNIKLFDTTEGMQKTNEGSPYDDYIEEATSKGFYDTLTPVASTNVGRRSGFKAEFASVYGPKRSHINWDTYHNANFQEVDGAMITSRTSWDYAQKVKNYPRI